MKTQPAQLVMGSKPSFYSRPLELLGNCVCGKNKFRDMPLANVQEVYLLASSVLIKCVDTYRRVDTKPRPVAYIAGDMLNPDEAWFNIIYLGLDGTTGGGTRYGQEKGLDAAQKAVTQWSQRHFRQEKN